MNRNAKWCIVFALILVLGVSYTQEGLSDSPVLTGPYFGQDVPGDTAVVFALGAVTTGHHEHSRFQFSKSGTEVFWAVIPVDTTYRTTGGSPFVPDEQNIWHSEIVNGAWTVPAVLDITRTSGGGSPTFSANGNVFYFRAPKPDADPTVRPRPGQLWRVSYDAGNWGEPMPENDLLPVQEGATFASFCFAENGNLYFDYGGPDETGEWWWKIYFSEFQDGGYLAPEVMGNGINDGEASWCPWIAPDESFIIYSSHREGEFGRGDLYINFKNDKGRWSGPTNMGRNVNTDMQERFPSMSPDGKYLFFTRHRPETFSDVLWVDARILDGLRQHVSRSEPSSE
jgi:hypothetical protein